MSTKSTESEDGRFRILKHGSTIHGAQQIEDDEGKPVNGRPKPITYYHDKSAMSRAIEAVRARKGGPLHVAVIGLGTGTLACLSAPDETWRFYEIDPVVVEIARDPNRFTFLSSCAPQVQIVIGDARLTLAKEPDHQFDLVIVDAYSSDAIPVHLATAEAMALYKSKLAPQGVVVMHISNRHLELHIVVEGIAAANGLKTWVWRRDDLGIEDRLPKDILALQVPAEQEKITREGGAIAHAAADIDAVLFIEGGHVRDPLGVARDVGWLPVEIDDVILV